MKKQGFLTYLYIFIIFLGTAKVYFNEVRHTAALPVSKKHIVLDAGHGGFDPGKVAADGTEEKSINLEIMQYLQGYLEQGGAVVSITRNDDTALAGKKKADLKGRLNIANNNDVDLFISVHQNSYPQENVHGAQVFFYKTSDNGKRLATAVQARLREVVDFDNKRVAKDNASYYILKNIDIPSIIVECGFLSNPQERERLKDKTYQQKIAWAIYMGIVDYYNQPNV